MCLDNNVFVWIQLIIREKVHCGKKIISLCI